MREAQAPCDRPTLICCKTVIGKGAPNKAGTHDVHGAALGRRGSGRDARGARLDARRRSRFPRTFAPPGMRARRAPPPRPTGSARFAAYARRYPDRGGRIRAGACDGAAAGRLRAQRVAALTRPTRRPTARDVATRKASQMAIEALAPLLPELFGGSADLTGSNLTNWKDCVDVGRGRGGNYIHYGVREFGMAAIHERHRAAWRVHSVRRHLPGVLRLRRNALRMAALMQHARDLRAHARQHRRSARTGHAPAGRARLDACA